MDAPQPSKSENPSIAVPHQRVPQIGGAARAPAGVPPVPPAGPPLSGPVPVPGPQPVGPMRAPGKRRWLRRVLPWILVVLVVGVVGAAGYGFIWYDRATAPDRSSPDATLSNYLGALLVERDDSRAGLYVCEAPHLAEMQELRGSIEQRERDLNTVIIVSWSGYDVRENGDEADIGASIERRATIDDTLQTVTDRWTFHLINQSGWRVCAATKAP